MDWRQKLQTAKKLASEGKVPAAVDLMKELAADPAAVANGKAVLWIFNQAVLTGESELAQQMARRLESFPGDEESFAAATWLKSAAAALFDEGNIEQASNLLTRALCVAPNHRRKILADPRIADLLKIQRDPSTTPMPKDARRRIRDAEKFHAQKKYNKAWETLSPLKSEDSNRIEAIRVGFNVAWHSHWNEMAQDLAAHMCRGNLMDRLLAAEWYLTYAVILRREGRSLEAANVISEGLRHLPEFREDFSKDPRLGGIVTTPGGMN